MSLRLFEHWKTVLEHPQAKLDDKRKKLIHEVFKSGYSVQQLCEAITGCSLTSHTWVITTAGNGMMADISSCGDANQIDRFMHNARSPPMLTHAESHTGQRPYSVGSIRK
jgi:hypothetical protein